MPETKEAEVKTAEPKKERPGVYNLPEPQIIFVARDFSQAVFRGLVEPMVSYHWVSLCRGSGA